MKYAFELKLYIVGLIVFSSAIGSMSTTPDGFIIFGGGLILLASGSALLKYLNDKQ